VAQFEQEFMRLADAVNQAFDPTFELDPKALAKQLAEADRLIPPSIWMKLRKAFTPKGLAYFQFYVEMRRIALGGPVPKGLKNTYKRAADRLAQVRSPYDGKPLSPAAVNAIALTRPEINRTIGRIEQDRMTPLYWGMFNATMVPLLIQIARDKGVFIKPTRQTGREKWATFRKMSPKQERIEKLRDDDPESYALMEQLGQTMEQIDANIEARILDEGMELKESFLAGRPVKIGVDPATGEEMVYDRDGEVVPKDEFFDKVRAKAEADSLLARVPTRTQVEPNELRLLSDEELDNLVGDQEWDAITDDKAKQGKLTRLFPTKRIRKFINDAETGETRVEEYKVVVEGRYKGCFLDDLINSEGRLIEGTAYAYDVKKGRESKYPKVMDPSEREPYVTVAEVITRRQFQGKRIKVKTKKLYLKIDGTRQNKELRNAIKSLACNAGTQRGCIPSVSYEAVPGSRAAGFYFDPKDFGVIMESLQGMSLSTAALAEVKSYYKELALAEEATKNLDAYEPEALASENEDGEKFQFVTGSFDKDGNWEPFSLREKQKEAIAWMDANGNSGVCALETGVGKCLVGSTRILTNRGLIQIKDMNPGITTPDTSAPIEGWSVLVGGSELPVQSFYYGGHRKTIKVRTRRGYEVEGSHSHPLLVRTPDGNETWVKTPELRAGDYLCVERVEAPFPMDPALDKVQAPNRCQTYPLPEQMTPDLGRLLGYFVAEGWTNHDQVVEVCQDSSKNPKVRADIEDLVGRLLGYTVTTKPENPHIKISSKHICLWLRSLGLNGQTAKDKTVPSVVLQSSKETVRQFIRGLVDAEGHVQGEGRNHIEFSTASEQLGRELQILLLRFGIVSSRRPKKVKGYEHTYWRLTISGQDAIDYGSKIGFVSERKQAAVENVGDPRNSNLDVVPHLAPAVGSLFTQVLTALDMNVSRFRREVRDGSASFDSTVNHVRLGRRNPTYSFLREMLSLAADAGCQDHPSFKAIVAVVDRQFFYDPIEVMEESDAVVMDITVDDDSHCFVGNGLMNHNTATSIGMMLKLVRDGLAEPDSTYTRPDGVEVTTNGRFLFVCPTSLRGNIKKELRGMLSDPKVMLDRVDVLTYSQFSGASKSGTVPQSLRGIPFWKARIGKGGKRAGHREVDNYKGLRAYWEFNSQNLRVYGVTNDEDQQVAEIVFDRRTDTWEVRHPDTHKRIETFTAKDDREGVKRALMTLDKHRGTLRLAMAYQSKKAWDPALYAAIFFDEAQAMKNFDSKVSQAALKLHHPRKICLTASPMERNPMEAYVLAAITNNTPLFGRSREAKDNRKEMRRFKERFCEVVGGRIVGIKQDPLVQRDLHTWVKRNVFHADKTEVKEYNLPKPTITATPVEMPPEVEELYRDVASGFATIMEGAARKFRERKKTDTYGDRQAEKLFSRALAPVIKLLTDMANRPAKALKDVAFAVQNGYLPDFVTPVKPDGTGGEPRPLPKPFISVLKKWQARFTPEDLEGMAAQVGNPKIQAAEDTIAAKLERAEGSRALLFSDDKAMCMEAGMHMASKMTGTHVVALNDAIHFFSGSTELDRLVYPLDTDLLNKLVKDPEERKRILAETGGVSTLRLPFRKKAYKKHPALPAKAGANTSYLADDWQQFVLKEIVNPDSSISSATMLGKTYMYGHNLQAFNTVIHLDRDSWNSESMKQRTARAWRQGQEQVVDEVTLDFTYRGDDEGKPRDPNDQTLDQIRRSFQEMDAGIFDSIIKDAQRIALGAEWEGVDKRDASLWRLNDKVLELMMSPMLERV
jgi:intein/homing endonuclease